MAYKSFHMCAAVHLKTYQLYAQACIKEKCKEELHDMTKNYILT